MSEYVVDFEGAIEEYHIETHNPSWAKERIVRCKDCKHAENMMKLHRSWFCKRNCCAKPPIEPDGFCSWGERREDD